MFDTNFANFELVSLKVLCGAVYTDNNDTFQVVYDDDLICE